MQNRLQTKPEQRQYVEKNIKGTRALFTFSCSDWTVDRLELGLISKWPQGLYSGTQFPHLAVTLLYIIWATKAYYFCHTYVFSRSKGNIFTLKYFHCPTFLPPGFLHLEILMHPSLKHNIISNCGQVDIDIFLPHFWILRSFWTKSCTINFFISSQHLKQQSVHVHNIKEEVCMQT